MIETIIFVIYSVINCLIVNNVFGRSICLANDDRSDAPIHTPTLTHPREAGAFTVCRRPSNMSSVNGNLVL